MLGIILVLSALIAIVFASYRLGAGVCEPDIVKRDIEKNTSLTVLALGVLFMMCGIMALVAGSNNPFDAIIGKRPDVPSS